MNDTVTRIVSKVMGIPVDDISGDSGPDTIDSWDSMAHLNLMVALESEFNITLSPEDAMEMRSVDLIKGVLRRYSDNVD